MLDHAIICMHHTRWDGLVTGKDHQLTMAHFPKLKKKMVVRSAETPSLLRELIHPQMTSALVSCMVKVC